MKTQTNKYAAPKSYRDSGYTSFLERTDPNLLDMPGGLPGEISPVSDLAFSQTDAGAQADANQSRITNSLQESADVISNATGQIVSIGTGNGLIVYSGANPSSGARVVLNSTGLAGYDALGNATFAIVAATGAASFAGTIDVGGADTSSFHVDIDGNLWLGAATYVPGTTPFTVSKLGVVVAKSFATGVTGQDRVELSDGDRVELRDSTNNITGTWRANSGDLQTDGDITADDFVSAGTYFRLAAAAAPSATNNFAKIYYKDSDDTLHFVDENGVDKALATV